MTGFEADANAAKEAILKIVGQYESMVQEEVSIDPRVHSMIIGKRGRSIRKIMEDFKVDIRLPRERSMDPWINGDFLLDHTLVLANNLENGFLGCVSICFKPCAGDHFRVLGLFLGKLDLDIKVIPQLLDDFSTPSNDLGVVFGVDLNSNLERLLDLDFLLSLQLGNLLRQ